MLGAANVVKALEQPQGKTYTIFGPYCKNKIERCKKDALYQNFLQIKVVKDSVPYEKVSGRICLSLPLL